MSTIANQQPNARAKSEDQNDQKTVPIGVVTDLELIEVAIQAGIDLEQEIHLFMAIEDVIL